MLEIELKFQIPAQGRERLWTALRRRHPAPRSLRAHYFDTPDGLLAAHAVAMRLRRQRCSHPLLAGRSDR